MDFGITRFDLAPNEDGVPLACINLVRPGLWRASGVPVLSDVDLRVLAKDNNYLKLKGPSSAIVVQIDHGTKTVYIEIKGKARINYPILNMTRRPGPWLLNKITLQYPNSDKEDLHRFNDDGFVKGDRVEVKPNYVIAGQNCRWLELRDARNRQSEVWLDLMAGKVLSRSNASGEYRQVATVSGYDTAQNAYMMTEFSTNLADDGPVRFVRVGPRDWIEVSSRSSNGQLLAMNSQSPYGFVLAGTNPTQHFYQVQHAYNQVRSSVPQASQDSPIENRKFGVQRWRHGQRVSSRSVMTDDPFHGTGQKGASVAHPFKDKAPLVYRSSVKLPPLAKYVDVRSTEEVTIDINHERVTVDATKPARVMLDRRQMLTITMPATDLSCPTLLVRASTMDVEDWHVIHPDIDVHKKLVEMKPGTMMIAQKDGHLPAHLMPHQLMQLHASVQGLARTIQYTHNTKPHGVHHDRAVHPPNLVHPHFHIKFGKKHPGGGHDSLSYRPMPTHEAKAFVGSLESHKNFTRLDNPAGQGLFDIFKTIGEAVEVVVHTVETVAGDFVDTASHVVKDVVDTVDAVGEHLAQGDLFSAGKDLLEGGEHIGSDIGHGIASAAGDVIKGGGQILVLTARMAGEVFQFVLDHTGIVGQAIRWVLEKAGAVVGSFIRVFLDQVGWQDVLHAHDIIGQTLDNGIDKLADLAGAVKETSDAFFDDLIASVADPIDKVIAGLVPHDLTRQTTPMEGHSKAMEMVEWLMGQVISHIVPSSPLPALPWQPSGPLDGVSQFLEDNFGSKNRVIKDVLDDGVRELEMIVSDIAHAPEHLLAALLEVVKGVITFGLKAVSKLIDIILDMAAAAFRAFGMLLKREINIPFVSQFYEGLTDGRKLTGLSLVSLLVALPATLISKAALGKSPFQSMQVAQEMSERDKAVMWGAIYSGSQFYLTVVSVVDDSLSIANDLDIAIDVEFDSVPSKPNTDIDFASLSKIDLGLRGLALAGGLLAQITANPVRPDLPYDVPHIDDESDPMMQANYWSHMVWMYQWGGFAFDTCAAVGTSLAEKGGIKKTHLKQIGDLSAVINTVRGLVHLPLMAAINDGDMLKRDVLALHLVRRDPNDNVLSSVEREQARLEFVNDTMMRPPGSALLNQTIYRLRRELAKRIETSIWETAKLRGATFGPRYMIVDNLVDRRVLPTDTSMTVREWLVEQVAFLDWAYGIGHDNTMPMHEKLFGNICDCLPEIGQVFAAPSVVEETFGLSLFGSATLDVFGHGAEASAHMKRAIKHELL